MHAIGIVDVWQTRARARPGGVCPDVVTMRWPGMAEPEGLLTEVCPTWRLRTS